MTRKWRIGTLIHCLWECKMVLLLWKTVPQKVKNKVTMIQQFHSQVFTQENRKLVHTKNISNSTFPR